MKVVRFDEAKFLWAMRNFRNDFAGFDQAFGFDPAAQRRIRNDESYLGTVGRFDAGEASFFARQLEFIKAKTYDVLYPEYKAQRLLPVSFEAGPGAETITYRQFNVIGQSKLLSRNGKDLPRVDTYGKEFTSKIKSFGNSYGYTVQEIRAAMYAQIPLEQRKANAARLSYEQKVNELAWKADGSAAWGGLVGLFYNANVPHATVANGNWLLPDGSLNPAVTPDMIIQDVNQIITSVPVLTKDVEHVTQVLMPVGHLAILGATPRSAISDTTILEFLKMNHPGVSFEAINEAANVSPAPATPLDTNSSTNLLIAYAKNPDKLTLEIPQPFEQFPVQEQGLEYQVPCHFRLGGIITYYPQSIVIAQGI
jgi:hypothetical protein